MIIVEHVNDSFHVLYDYQNFQKDQQPLHHRMIVHQLSSFAFSDS